MITKILKILKIKKHPFNGIELNFKTDKNLNLVDFRQKDPYIDQTPLMFAIENVAKYRLSSAQIKELIEKSDLNDLDKFKNNAFMYYLQNIDFKNIQAFESVRENLDLMIEKTNLSVNNCSGQNPLTYVFEKALQFNLSLEQIKKVYGLSVEQLIKMHNKTSMSITQREKLINNLTYVKLVQIMRKLNNE